MTDRRDVMELVIIAVFILLVFGSMTLHHVIIDNKIEAHEIENTIKENHHGRLRIN